ncbi:adenylyltransferase/cytidyltransferase family protein [Pseudaminobacter soli (ex Li et al. 2025)]|uniref:Cytidyltransferase n=1 Tax=Pseudaminobacter soli (ex Li et al. 2025) TaxID=1295366 RepID=A0A2P7SJT2_9HYPH|nr:adenylyltransferase/cytidyltransferase family protein [Mesorhizobium soli]PSJ62740.1 cytidyltransferase [Mesorhizobium soli]
MSRIGYAPGTLDLFHVGHLNLLRNARAHCDILIAGVVSDEIALRAKGVLPVIPVADRLEILRCVKFVDAACPHTADDILAVWRELQFNVLFKGDDRQGTMKGDRLERDLATVGVEMRYFPYTTTVSSTLLRRILQPHQVP